MIGKYINKKITVKLIIARHTHTICVIAEKKRHKKLEKKKRLLTVATLKMQMIRSFTRLTLYSILIFFSCIVFHLIIYTLL